MVLPGAEPFFWRGTNKKGVLLIHGFTGSPSELRELGEELHRKGYTVEGLLLAGHGTDPHDLLDVKAEQWEKQVRQGVAHLRACCSRVTVVGLSMGGLLTLYAGAVTDADKLVVISTPIYLYDWRIYFLWLADQLPYWAIPKHPRTIDAPERYNVAYRCMPIKAVHQLVRLLKAVKGKYLPRVHQPLLIIQSRMDHTVRPESASYIEQHAASARKQVLWVPQARHVMTLYKGRQAIYTAIEAFLEE
ncbi:alpha/beta fold hydrolase [Acidaminococcus fermentans]|uniref:alpha/beta hydrolase n=1 Tax=Acidaminococcus fermentans TaxID=905 RepID=UPI00242F3951|nr:alpha/beta fold hydrolase [Acidaminococcus fermentans]